MVLRIHLALMMAVGLPFLMDEMIYLALEMASYLAHLKGLLKCLVSMKLMVLKMVGLLELKKGSYLADCWE